MSKAKKVSAIPRKARAPKAKKVSIETRLVRLEQIVGTMVAKPTDLDHDSNSAAIAAMEQRFQKARRMLRSSVTS